MLEPSLVTLIKKSMYNATVGDGYRVGGFNGDGYSAGGFIGDNRACAVSSMLFKFFLKSHSLSDIQQPMVGSCLFPGKLSDGQSGICVSWRRPTLGK